MVKYIGLTALFCLALGSFAQESEEVLTDSSKVFTICQEQPEFRGGEEALHEFIQEHLNYPEMARNAGISGRVYVSFIVEKTGSLSDIHVTRGIGGGCDQEAVRVVESMPKWIAGKNSGETVRVRMNLPIEFDYSDL